MSIPGILLKIVETKKSEVAELKKNEQEIRSAVAAVTRKPLPFKDILANTDGLAVISEVKKASPSAGVICPNFNPVEMAKAYEAGGATAISVLTDIDYFQGHPDYLKEVRKHVDIPLLRKDFIIDELQIYEALTLGADTYLLIVAILSESELNYLINVGKELGMTPLVEIHDEEELQIALNAGAEVIGVNNRDLRNFTVDMGLTARLSPKIPEGCILIGESGIKTVSDAAGLRKSGCKGILIGETLMREGLDNCGKMIGEMHNC
ncbi:MAG: indole-3-glycerol phosphate synthase TrpC [Lentisphaeraceae bacterium]|nr:indole-3-glycerol phosphate synthase TrpC [Lentisphaeraceae bacterium]